MSESDHTIIQWKEGRQQTLTKTFIHEEPLSIRVQGTPYVVVMRTPGDEIAHVAGFCLAEGLVDRPEDIVNIAMCDGEDTNVVTVTLTPARQKIVAGHLDRRGYISQTSCGLCGKTLIDELYQTLHPIDDPSTIAPYEAETCLRNLDRFQPMRSRSAASHAAALFDDNLNILAAMEDVGRHNALDKVVGRLFLDNRLHLAKVLVMSSRISYELVQKAARARIPIFLAHSRPTRLAIGLADQLNMTLAGAIRPSGLFLYTHTERFTL